MYKIVYWLQGKIYKVQDDGQLAPEIVHQDAFRPFQTELIESEEKAKTLLKELSVKVGQKVNEAIQCQI